MAASISTRERLHSIIDDIELLTRELLHLVTAGKDGAALEHLLGDAATASAASAPGLTVAQLLEALVLKDAELKSTMATAEEQAANQKTIAALKAKLDKKNASILQVQKSLKEAESSLASVMYEARKKLESIRRSEEKAISAEDLIKFAHRISASGSVAAPPTWAPGDTSRRPYPTDMEMRQGFLARNWSSTLGSSTAADGSTGVGAAATSGVTDVAYRSTGIDSSSLSAAATSAGSTFWHSAGGDYSTANAGSAAYLQAMVPAPASAKPGVKGQNKENEDVEMMSDSSSSSTSSDE